MAFKLTKAESKRRDELVAALEIAAGEIAREIDEANVEISRAQERVNVVIDAYNSTLNEARDWRDEIVSQWRDDFDDKSERWQEGEKGQAVASFVASWGDLELDDLEESDIDLIEDPEPSHRDELEAMAEGADDEG